MGDTPNPDWNKQWQALARQYGDAWQELARGAAGTPPPPPPSPMQQGFEQWARLWASGDATREQSVERMVESARGYASFLQAMLGNVSASPDAGSGAWTEALRNAFGAGAPMPPFMPQGAAAWPDLPAQMAGGMGQWLQWLQSARGIPGAGNAAAPWLEMPAFGYLREHQERLQQGAVALADYREQLGRYNGLMLKAMQRGFELFEGKLLEREEPGRQVESLRALYDLWVDAAEEGYAEIALSPEFREAYGALVNAQMRVRSAIQQEVEHVGRDLGMPTRSEIDTLGKRLHDLRREVRAQQGGGDGGLAGEVARLREEVAALRRGTSGARGGAPADRARAAAEPAAADAASGSARKSVPSGARPTKAGGRKASSARTSGGGKSATGKPVAKPSPAKAPASRKAGAPGRRRPAHAQASGSFASRIARFADDARGGASGSAAPKTPSEVKPATTGRGARARRPH